MKSFKPTEYKVIGIHHEFDILIKNKRIVNKLREIIHLNNSYNPNCSFKTINLLSEEPGADTLNHEFTIKLNVSNPDTSMNTIYEFLNRYIVLTYHVLGVDIIQPSSDDACVKANGTCIFNGGRWNGGALYPAHETAEIPTEGKFSSFLYLYDPDVASHLVPDMAAYGTSADIRV
jgi:hypothetical protein